MTSKQSRPIRECVPLFLLSYNKGTARRSARKKNTIFDLQNESNILGKRRNQYIKLNIKWTWSSFSISSLTSFIPSPSPIPPPSMSSNSVAPSPSPSSISGGRQNPLEPRSVKILNKTDSSLLVVRWVANKLTSRLCERFKYSCRRGMELASNCVQNSTDDSWTGELEADPVESAMSLSCHVRLEIAFVTFLKSRLLISLSKLWWRRVVKCPSRNCKSSTVWSARETGINR